MLVPITKCFTVIITLTASQRTWEEIGSNTECDTTAGEDYRDQSPGKVANLAECKKSCEDDAGCQSITLFKSGWCSHFSTGCTNTKVLGKAVSMRLQGTTTKAPPGQRRW